MRGSEDVRERLEALTAEDREVMVQVRIHTKRQMTECGVSARQLARNAGLSNATVSNWLKGESELEGPSLLRVCGAVDALRPHGPTASILRKAEALALGSRSEALAATG